MAKVWCMVAVLIFVQNVFASSCPDNSKIKSCDQCIRCGAKWCTQAKVDVRCSFADKDDWCSEPESLVTMDPYTGQGKSLQPVYAERTLYINQDDWLPFSYKADREKKVSVMIYNTTQNLEGVDIAASEAICSGDTCNLHIAAKVSNDFCTSLSTVMEFVYISVKVEGISEEAVIKYHVPCACECTKKRVEKAPQCSGNGKFRCGACECYDGWSGPRCDKTQCSDRGDVPNTCHELGCSNNGYCGPCGNCICYHDREGSQYFDPRNLCADICMATSELEANCGPCLTTHTNGTCPSSLEKSECHPRIKMVYNATITSELDNEDRKIWVKCNDTFDLDDGTSRHIHYFVMMEEEEGYSTYWMMVVEDKGDSQQIITETDPAQTKVPLILGVLGILAAVAAVGGVMLWKHLNSAPPMPFASPDYQNIDAEDCVGENPLYKPPTSTFTNPQFGKC